ncbi:hypothetical protein ABIB73_002433 [Bradyrhizobium sp. F1.4.3]
MLEGDRCPSLVSAATETNPARAAARLPIAPSPCPSGLLRSALSSREPRSRPGWRRPASRAPARPCPMQPAPCRPPADGVHAPSAWPPLPSPVQARGASVPVRRRERPFVLQPCRRGERKVSSPLGHATCGRRLWSATAKIGGQLGMFAERSVGSNRTPENDAGLCHGRSDDVRIVALLRRALMEEVAVSAPRLQRRLHRRSGDRQIEEAQRSLVGLQFSGHRFDPPFPDRSSTSRTPRRRRNTTRPRSVP